MGIAAGLCGGRVLGSFYLLHFCCVFLVLSSALSGIIHSHHRCRYCHHYFHPPGAVPVDLAYLTCCRNTWRCCLLGSSMRGLGVRTAVGDIIGFFS